MKACPLQDIGLPAFPRHSVLVPAARSRFCSVLAYHCGWSRYLQLRFPHLLGGTLDKP